MASNLPDAAKQRLEWWRWPVAAVTDDHTPEGLDHALATTRWGRCAYKVGDNDQPSAQTVSIRFANGVLANFTLQSGSHRTMRTVRVNGTRGSAWGELRALDGWLKVADHRTGRVRSEKVPTAYDGHGGGERPLFRDFLRAIGTGRPAVGLGTRQRREPPHRVRCHGVGADRLGGRAAAARAAGLMVTPTLGRYHSAQVSSRTERHRGGRGRHSDAVHTTTVPGGLGRSSSSGRGGRVLRAADTHVARADLCAAADRSADAAGAARARPV